MRIAKLHRWDVTSAEAIALQRDLAARVDVTPPLGRCDLIAGADASYRRGNPRCYASVVVWRASTGELVDAADAAGELPFPYVPGLLSFREAPILLDAFAKLKTVPDVVLCDGQGTAHPRRFGLACHLGLWLNLPTVGCGKTRLCGTFAEPAAERGAWEPLVDAGDVVGAVLRTKTNVKPLFVSPGHRINAAGAIATVLAAGRGYRQPEPTRLAHHRVNGVRAAGG